MGCASTQQQQQQDDEKPIIVRNFHFPIKRNAHLLTRWERFVNKDATWKAKEHTVLCSRHFDKTFIISNQRDANLDWKADPIPSIYINDKYKCHPSLIPTPVATRKPPTIRNFQEDQLPTFLKKVCLRKYSVSELKKCRNYFKICLFFHQKRGGANDRKIV